jgi:hypothetical protein
MSWSDQQLMDPLGPAETETDTVCDDAGVPPPELLAEMARADARHAALAAAGRRVEFHPADEGGRVRIELHSAEGSRELSLAEALDLACDPCSAEVS